jgi:hypothetical protein
MPFFILPSFIMSPHLPSLPLFMSIFPAPMPQAPSLPFIMAPHELSMPFFKKACKKVNKEHVDLWD